MRPVRVAFFVPPDHSSFIRAAAIATSQWGGLHCLIVPVYPEKTPSLHGYFEQALKLIEPDLFVGLSSGDQAFRGAVQGLLERVFPWRKVHLRCGDDFEQHDASMHALSVIPDDVRSQCAMRLPIVRSWPAAVNAAVFGRFSNADMPHYLDLPAGAREEGLDATDIWTPQIATDWSSSPLNLTAYGLSPTVVSDGLEAPWFELVVGEEVNVLCFFWAIRAVRDATQFMPMGRRTLLCTMSDIHDSTRAAALTTMIRENLAVEGLFSNVDLLLYVWTDDDLAAAKTALRHLGVCGKTAGTRRL